jgi:p-hydroxybenzoate 3-monooxygenase
MSRTIRTQVAIVGAGPAGLTLSCLLAKAGIESVVLENRSRRYVEARIRAGVLEQGTAEVLESVGVGERMRREGIVHHGIHLQFAGERHRVPLSELADGRRIVVYGQTEVVKDLIQARLDAGLALLFEVADVSVHDIETDRPSVRFSDNGERFELICEAIAGCDGFHGICRPAIAVNLETFSREYPFGWLGILADVEPSSDELVYAHHERGFALLSLRSPQRSRLYLQCAADERLENWSDVRIWDELQRRVALDGWILEEGAILEKGITGMRSFVTTPMQHGRLFLAGDAAHIVPPTGAKGLNLAVADVTMLAEGLIEFLTTKDEVGLAGYSARCLRRVWRAEQFSYWMTSTLHRLGDDPFDEQMQLSQLRYLVSSEAAARSLAENYVGLPIDNFAPLAAGSGDDP